MATSPRRRRTVTRLDEDEAVEAHLAAQVNAHATGASDNEIEDAGFYLYPDQIELVLG